MKAVFVGAMLFAAAAFSVRGDYAASLLAHGPVAYWRFDETTTSPPLYTITNYSPIGTVLNGYGVGTVNSGQPGIIGNCARFNNPGNAVGSLFSKIDVPWNAAINPSPPFTIEFWAKPNSLGTDITGFCPLENFDPNFSGGSRAGWVFYLNNAAKWQFRLGNRSSYAGIISGTNGNATPGVWQHIVATWDGGTANLYANGSLIGSGPVGATNWVNNPQSFLRMGGTPLSGTNAVAPIISVSSNNGHRGYDGWLDEVAIYNTALSTSTINAHYQAAATNNAGYHAQILSDHPVGYWELDEPAVTAPAPSTFPLASNIGSLGASADATNMWGALANQPGPGYSGLGGSSDRAVFFDGDNGFCQIKDAAGLHFSRTISLLVWVKPAEQDFFRNIIAHGFTTSGAETFLRISRGAGFDGSGDGNYYEIGSSDGTYYDSALFPIPPGDIGNWVFLAGTFDGANWKLYHNGQLVSSITTLSAGDNGAIDVPGPWTIGSRQVDAYFAGQEYSFGGTMDEPAIFTNALSDSDILALYYAAQVPPIFTRALQNPGTVAAGSNLSFSVWAEGNPVLSYLWTSNGIITGVTATNYLISNIQQGTYTIGVVVTNAYGTNSSSVTFDAINVSPSISAQPISTTRIAGYPFNFSVTASGTPQLTYYWMLGNTVVQSGAASNYTAIASLANAGSYTVIVSNVTGVNVTSTPAVLTVNPVPSGYGGAVVASGPMAFWRLDETNGLIARDQISGIDGTYLNATLGQLPSYSPLDPNETAVAFNGVNSYVGKISGTAINFTGHTNFTLEAWVKAPAGLADGSTIIVKGIGWEGTPHTEQFDLDVYNGVYRFYVASSSYAPINETDATEGPNGAWQHVVAVYDDQNTLGGGSNMYIFVNGAQQGSTPVPTNGLNTTTSQMSIGSKRFGNDPDYTGTFNGLVSQVAVYGKALDASTIFNHYAAAYGTNNTCLFPSLLRGITASPTNVNLIIQASAGCSYQMQTAVALTGPWNNLGAPFTMPTNGLFHFTDTNALAVARFYRATTLP